MTSLSLSGRPSAQPSPAWTLGGVAAAPGVRRLTLGGREAVFCERRQQLCELQPGGAALFDALAGGRRCDLLVAAFAGEAAGDAPAAEAPAALARAWLQAGWLVPRALLAHPARAPDDELPLRVGGLDLRLELHTAGDGRIPAMLRDAFRQFGAEVDPGAARWRVVSLGGAWFVLAGEHPVRMLSAAQVTPEVKALLTAELCRRTRAASLLLHSAMLERDGRALLLSGAPGAGKTTLTVALATSGLGYLTDDVVCVTSEGVFSGLPFAPALKAGAWPLLESRLPGLQALATHRRADDQAVRYLPVEMIRQGAPATPVMALVLDRREGAPASIHPLDPLTALTELLGSAFSADHRLGADTLEAMADRFGRMTCGRLVYSDLTAAVELVLARLAA